MLGILLLISGAAEAAAPPSNLAADLEAYLWEPDEAAAKARKDRLVRHSVKELEQALQGRTFAPTPERGRIPERLVRVGGKDASYALRVPKDYAPERSYPLLVCLHGTGFDGAGYLDRWEGRLGDAFFLACPTSPDGEWWSPEAEQLVLGVIRDVTRGYRIATDRIFLTGMSSGGVGTYLIGLNHTDLFAGQVPMAGALPRALFPLLDNLGGEPIYLIHGSRDGIIPVEFSRQVDSYLKAHNLPHVYREHDREHPQAGGHFFPKEELPDLVAWMEKQKRSPWPRTITVVRDRDHLGRSGWIRLEEVEDVASLWDSFGNREEGQALQEGKFARIEGAVEGNTIRLRTDRVRRFSILLSDRLVSLDRPVRVIVNDRERFKGQVRPDAAVFLDEARARPDPQAAVEAVIPIRVQERK